MDTPGQLRAENSSLMHARTVISAAFDEARRLDHGWVGTEHFLLALLSWPSVVTEVLGEHGVTYDSVAEHLRHSWKDVDRPSPHYDAAIGLSGPNPSGHQLIGRAEGLTVAAGSDAPKPEHWLLAMVYDKSVVVSLLHHLGAPQEAVLAGLRRHGVRVPDVEPPWYKPRRGNRRVEVAETDLDPFLQLLVQRHPPGSEWRWGFNWLPGEPRRALVGAEEGIDVSALLDELTGSRNHNADDSTDES